jgi:hypothetical protein
MSEEFEKINELECGCVDTCKGHDPMDDPDVMGVEEINAQIAEMFGPPEISPEDDGRLVNCLACCAYHPLILAKSEDTGEVSNSLGYVECAYTSTKYMACTGGRFLSGHSFIDEDEKEDLLKFDAKILKMSEKYPKEFQDYCRRVAISITIQVSQSQQEASIDS